MRGFFPLQGLMMSCLNRKTSWNAPNTHSLGCWLECVSSFCRFNSLSLHGNLMKLVWPVMFFQGTGVAFAPEPCWVAFAPEWSGMKWVQGRMWPSFRGECDPCFCVAGAIVSEPQKDFLHPRESYSRVMRRSNSHFNQLPGHYGCYGVPLLRCNIHFEQLRRCFP